MIGTSTGMPVCAEPEHLGARAPADMLADHQIARVEIGLRPDPALSPMTQVPSKRPWI